MASFELSSENHISLESCRLSKYLSFLKSYLEHYPNVVSLIMGTKERFLKEHRIFNLSLKIYFYFIFDKFIEILDVTDRSAIACKIFLVSLSVVADAKMCSLM